MKGFLFYRGKDFQASNWIYNKKFKHKIRSFFMPERISNDVLNVFRDIFNDILPFMLHI